MLAVARGRVPTGVGLKQGQAEELPFRDGWFDRVVYSLVIHLVDRPRALAEAARVLVPDGRVVVATFSHEHFDRYWAGRFFPSLAAVDKARFPTEDELVAELATAGFDEIRSEALFAREEVERDVALERLRGRHISTFDLLDPEEVRRGIEQAEAELPETVEIELAQLLVTGRRAAR